MSRSSPTSRRALSRLTITVLAVVAGLGLAEGLCRLFPVPASQLRRLVAFADDARGFVLQPGTRMEFHGLHEPISPPVIWEVNAQGLRADREIAPAAKGRRVLTYGDSEAFGWSVNLEETFQRVLERGIPGLEVVNLGVPGYNTPEVALHVELTAEALRPDLILYLVHPNDFEPAMIRVDERWLRSALVRRALFAYVMLVVEERNEQLRRSPQQLAAFRDGMRRIVAVCRRLEIECVAAFLDHRDLSVLRDASDLAAYFLTSEPRRAFEVARVLASHREVDRHLSVAAHRALAAALAGRLAPAAESALPGTGPPVPGD